MKLTDDFMKHFRWITPMLLAFSVYMLQTIYSDFRELRANVEKLNVDVVSIKVYLTKKIER